MTSSSLPTSPLPSPLPELEELALFERTCDRLIGNPELLKSVIQKAGITDNNRRRLTRRYGGS
jgi:hypothetical protein